MNKKIKNALSFIMAMIMVFSMLTIAPYAASDVVSLSTTAKNFKQGEKVVVTVKFNRNFESAAALDVSLKYDSTKLEVSSVTKGSAINKARDLQDDDVYSETHSVKGEVRWVFAGTKNYQFSGVFATVEFVVSGRATSGTTAINFVVNDATSKDIVDVKSQLTSSPLEIKVERSAENDMRFKLNADGKSYSITGYGSGERTSLEIPAVHLDLPVTKIANGAFANHEELTEIKFSSSFEAPCLIDSIGGEAFSGCSSLKSIDIPNTVMSIGASAFEDCTALNSVELSYSLTSISEEAFKGCTALSTIKIPFNVTEIKTDAFMGCSKLATVYISKNTKSIDETAFVDCAPLTFYTVEGNTTIDAYNTETKLGATVSKTLKDLSLGKATAAASAVLVRGGATPAVTITLTNGEKVAVNKDYTIVYINNYQEGNAKIVVAGTGAYYEGYNHVFTIVCEHNWNRSVETLPTCTKTGLYHLQCDICGKESTEVIPATGHVSNEWVIDKLPTITSTGLKHKVCMDDHVIFDKNTIIDKVVPDADRDGKVTSSDALIVLQYTVGIDDVMTADSILQVDCNGDGKINSVDALTILRIVVGDIVL